MTLEKLERLQEEANAKVKEMYEEKQIDIAETHQHVRNMVHFSVTKYHEMYGLIIWLKE